MTQVTSRIGIVPTFGTYAYHPYLLARLVATLDQVSGGRIGWNAVTGSSDFAAMNFGMQGMPEHDLRYDMADEYMEVCRGLWGSWEPGAIVADRKSGVLVDHTKVHAVNYQRQILQHARPAQFRTGAAGPAGHRPGRRLAARPQVRRRPCRHHRRQCQGHRGDARLSRRRAQAHGRAGPQAFGLQGAVPHQSDPGRDHGGGPGAQAQAGLPRHGAYRRAAGAFRQGDQHRLRQVRSRQAPARPRDDQRPSAEPRAVPQDGERPFHPRDHGELQRRRPVGGARRHARRRRRAHGRGHAGGRRRRLPVLHAQRQPPHPGGDRGRADPRPSGSRPDAQEPTSTRSSATIFWRSDQPEQEGNSHHAQTPFSDAASAAAPPWGSSAPASPRPSSVRRARKPPGPSSHVHPGRAEGHRRGPHRHLRRHHAGGAAEAPISSRSRSFQASRCVPSRAPTRPRSRRWSRPATSNGTWRSSAAARS